MRAASKSRKVAKTLVRSALWLCACNLLAAALAAQCSNPTQVQNGAYTSGDHSQVDNNALSATNVVLSGGATATFVAGNCIHLLPSFHANAIGATVPTTFHAWVETAPAVVSVSPASGSGLSQPFTWTVSSPSGYGNLSDVFALFNTSLSGVNACYIRYNRTSNLLYLADNTGLYWTGGFRPDIPGSSAANSYCSIYSTGSSVSTSGTQLALTVSVTFQPVFAGTWNTYLLAQDNEGLTSEWQQVGTWTVPAPPQDFTISTSPGTEVAFAQGTASYTVTATALNGFGGTITLGAPALPPGASPTFTPSSLSGQGTSRMAVALGAGGGNFNVTARGTNGSLSHSATSVLDVQDFSLTVSPWSQTVATGGTATVVLTAAGLGGFNGSINLAVYGAPSCSQISYSPYSITPGSPATFYLHMMSCPPGGYSLGIGGCYGTLCRYIGATVYVGSSPDFTITASPNSQTVAAGGYTSYTISTTSFNGFSGTIYLSLPSLPSGVSASFGSSSVAAGGSTTLTVYASAGAAAGTYTLGVTGQSGSLTRQAAPFLTISTTGISVGVTPPAITLTAGQAQQITANVAGSSNTVVMWSLSGPGTLTGATSNTVQYSAPATLSGNSTATITATSQADGLTTGTAQITLAQTQYYLTTSAGTGGIISPSSGWQASGSSVTVQAGVNPAYTFTGFSGDLGGTTNPQNVTMNASKSVTAGFAPASTVIHDPSYLYVNLGFIPFGSYYDDNQHLASSSPLSSSCPAGSTVRGCVQTILGNLRAQSVSGIRIVVSFCAATSESQAFPNCGASWQQVSWNPSGVPSQATWIANVGNFLQDVRDYLRPPPLPLPNVVLTFAFGPNSATPISLPKDQTTSPSGASCGAETPDPVYFYPLYPVGVMAGGWDIGWSDNNTYNCAPTNPFFIGWNNAFNAIDAVLGAAQGRVIVAELETQQELNMVGYTSQLRLIYDNTNLESAGQDPNDPNNRWVDVLSRLRGLMTGRGFDPGRVNWSAPWTDSSTDISQCPINGIGTVTGTCNCVDVYQGYARQMALNAVAGAIGGGWVGLPSDAVILHTGGLACGGTVNDPNRMQPSPIYNTQPDIADSHMYPHVEGAGQSDTQIQAIAALDYSDLAHFLNYINPLAATMMIGETHSGYIIQGCSSYPATAAVPNVAGFNQSAIAGRSVIFQPWMNLEGSCWPYNSGGQDNYQNVNYNGSGPYTPTRN